MGSSTPNLGLYKPSVGETGWGSLVDGNFDTLDGMGATTAQIQYCHGAGDDANNGQTWQSAKKSVSAAYESLPANGGRIYVGAGATWQDDPAYGLWIMGGSGTQDSQYASPPPGWTTTTRNVEIIGITPYGHGFSAHGPQVTMPAPTTGPHVWVNSYNPPFRMRNINMPYGWPHAMVLGVDSDGVTMSTGNGATFCWFENCGFARNRIDAAYGGYTAVEIAGSFWIYFDDCTFEAGAESAPLTSAAASGGTATFTTTYDHYLRAGDIVIVADVSVGDYNGTWTVLASPTSRTFTAVIGATPGAGTGGSVLPVVSRWRAAFSADTGTTGTSVGLFYIRRGQFANGDAWISSTGGGGNVVFEENIYEGSWGFGGDPSLFYLDADLDSVWLRNNAQSDANVYFGASAYFTSRVSSTTNVVAVGTTISGTGTSLDDAHGPSQVGFNANGIHGPHPQEAYQFAPILARGLNGASHDSTNWSATSATITDGQPAPDGTTNAALIHTTGAGGGARTFNGNVTVTLGGGDWLILGGWVKAEDTSYLPPRLYGGFGNTAIKFSNGNNVFAYYGNEPLGTSRWEWVCGGLKVATTGGLSGSNGINTWFATDSASGRSGYGFAPLVVYIPASAALADDDMAEMIRHLRSWPATAAAGQLGLLAGHSLHIPSGYIEGFEVAEPAAPADTGGRIFFMTNGGGKTKLMVRFPSGASQQIALEP